ncbi:MAG: hypothetical protein GKR98_06185 [Boseongicola sp.]|nr:MAG: hypothetical protein GKR98_06185 [Boseongicola sp.]
MNSELANKVLSGAVLTAIGLLGVGYFKLNRGVDAAYAACRSNNDVTVCACWREGFTASRTIFTETPLIGWLTGPTQDAHAAHMQAVNARCGVVAASA